MPTSLDLAKLIEQIPSTDQEIEALEQAARLAAQAKSEGKAPPPEPAPTPEISRAPAGKFSGPDPALTESLCGQLAEGGPSAWTGLIASIRDPAADEFINFKAEYLFHCLSVYLGRPERAKLRASFARITAAQVRNEELPVYVRGFLVRELQWVGGPEVIRSLSGALQHPDLFEDAARVLVAIGPDAAAALRRFLKQASPRQRLVLLHGLAQVRDAGSAKTFREALKDPETDVRLAAAWGLARLADFGSIDLLLQAANVEPVWERNQLTSACLLMAEHAVQNSQPRPALRIYRHLQETRTHKDEQYVRDVAAEAIRKLGVVS